MDDDDQSSTTEPREKPPSKQPTTRKRKAEAAREIVPAASGIMATAAFECMADLGSGAMGVRDVTAEHSEQPRKLEEAAGC